MVELLDLRNEWIDRYGALPDAASGLLDLGELRLLCLELGVTTLSVLPVKVGVRSKPVVRLGPLDLSVSQQMRLRRKHGSRAYDEDTKEFRIEVGVDESTPRSLLGLLRSLVSETAA
jgi:transcription-repair coupling factor (superfamily II helicase)